VQITRRHSLQASVVRIPSEDASPVPNMIFLASASTARTPPDLKQDFQQDFFVNNPSNCFQDGTTACDSSLNTFKTDSVEGNLQESPNSGSSLGEMTSSFSAVHHVSDSRSCVSDGNAIRDVQESLNKPTAITLPPELRKFVTMQKSVNQLRVHVRERRRALKNVRDNVVDADRRFMDALRVSWTIDGIGDPSKLETLYNLCVLARDKAGPATDDFEQLELGLSAEEFDLNDYWDAILDGNDALDLAGVRDDNSNEGESHFSFSSSSDGNEHLEPRDSSKLYGVHLGRDLAVGQEPELSNMTQPAGTATHHRQSSTGSQMAERQSVAFVGEEEMGKSMGETMILSLDFSAPDLDEKTYWNPLDGQEPHIHELELSSDEIGQTQVFEGEDGSLGVSELRITGSMDGWGSDDMTEHRNYLLQFENVYNRIERWMLHQLRSSTREIYQFKYELGGLVHNWTKFISKSEDSGQKWNELALELWEADSTSNDRTPVPDNLQNSLSSPAEDTSRHVPPEIDPISVEPPTKRRYQRSDTSPEQIETNILPPKCVGTRSRSSSSSAVEISPRMPFY
jgi:hypothetical protein